MATTNHTENEKDLLLKLQNGDHAAFEQLYHIYSPIIYNNLLKLTKSEDSADDFLQDIFLKLWQRREDIKPDGSLKGYLVTISFNLFKKSIRKLNIETKLNDFLTYSRSELHHAVEETINFKETNELLQRAIDKLPPQRRKVFQLCRMEGISYEQAATMLGVSSGTIHDHISKANKFIKQELVSGGPELLATILTVSLFLP